MRAYVLRRKIALARRGDVNEMYELGKAYLYGEDVKRNVKKGEKYLIAAANKNHADAQYEIGKFYLNDDCEKAELWLGKAAVNGNDEAAHLMGRQYFNGLRKAARNTEKAAWWFEIAAKRGHIPSVTMLGEIYISGSRKAEGIKLLSQAAEHGDAEAQFYLARSLGAKNYEKAAALLKKAIDGGIMSAYSALLALYASAGQYEEADKLVKEIKSKGIKPEDII